MRSIPLFKVISKPDIERNAIDVLRSGQIASGPFVGKFESRLRDFLGVENVLTTSDMTSAIKLALTVSGIGPGHEVLTTPFACLSTNSAISAVGAKPKWVDLEKCSVNIDVADLKRKISSSTRALLLYHVAGYVGNLDELVALCKDNNIILIEDCNNSLGSTFSGKKVGAIGDFGVFSFYPNRQINCGEGGALVCRRKADSDRAIRLRRFGIDQDSFRDEFGEINSISDVPEIGFPDTMSNLNASLGCPQFDDLNERLSLANRNAERLKAAFRESTLIEVVEASSKSTSAYWVLLVWVRNRNSLMHYLKEKGIGASKLHYRNDKYSGFDGGIEDELHNVGLLQEHILALPCGWWLSEDDVDYIIVSCGQWEKAFRTKGIKVVLNDGD